MNFKESTNCRHPISQDDKQAIQDTGTHAIQDTDDRHALEDTDKHAQDDTGTHAIQDTDDKHALVGLLAVCCSVLQCVAVCCSVLQCVAVCMYCIIQHALNL